MKIRKIFRSKYAVSEILGGILLVLIALLVFVPVYLYIFPLPFPEPEAHIKLEGFVEDNGLIKIKHMGGQPLYTYKIEIRQPDGSLLDSTTYDNPNNPWKIGEIKKPLDNLYLITENDKVSVKIYTYEEGTKQNIFYGIFKGQNPISVPFNLPMLISTLRTNTTAEDITCFNYTINASINAQTFIYNWTVNDQSINNIYLPFDTNNPTTTKDYSGNNNHGTVNGSTWNNNGIVGGNYNFNGIDNYIEIPYCFDNNQIDKFTFETWIKTNQENESIISFNSERYWDLHLYKGKPQLVGFSNGKSAKITSSTVISDGTWHHLTMSYNSLSGNCTFYIDGEKNIQQKIYTSGSSIGDGSTPAGYIGKCYNNSLPASWNILTYDDFEQGFGNYTDGGRDCQLYTGGSYAYQGNNAVNIQDDSGIPSSFYHTNGIDVSTTGYTSIKIDFWYIAHSMENWESFLVEYYDGIQWNIISEYEKGNDFENNQFYHETITINETDYSFPSNMKIRFRCDASSDFDDIIIDQVYVNATKGSAYLQNFSGSLDELKMYNRVLSDEQIHQNYLSEIFGNSNKRTIVSEETKLGDIWRCYVTPNDSTQDGEIVSSNPLQIINYPGGK
ncbi:MAG: LamG-like jellyroll fold domain-containing protein [Candidatus Thermoplasmatota archaeon]